MLQLVTRDCIRQVGSRKRLDFGCNLDSRRNPNGYVLMFMEVPCHFWHFWKISIFVITLHSQLIEWDVRVLINQSYLYRKTDKSVVDWFTESLFSFHPCFQWNPNQPCPSLPRQSRTLWESCVSRAPRENDWTLYSIASMLKWKHWKVHEKVKLIDTILSIHHQVWTI